MTTGKSSTARPRPLGAVSQPERACLRRCPCGLPSGGFPASQPGAVPTQAGATCSSSFGGKSSAASGSYSGCSTTQLAYSTYSVSTSVTAVTYA